MTTQNLMTVACGLADIKNTLHSFIKEALEKHWTWLSHECVVTKRQGNTDCYVYLLLSALCLPAPSYILHLYRKFKQVIGKMMTKGSKARAHHPHPQDD